MTEIDRESPWLATSVAALAAAVAVAPLALLDTAALVPGGIGLLLVLTGSVRTSRRAVTWGGALLLCGVVVAGVRGAPPEALLVALLGSVLAYDAAEHGLGVGAQLGRESATDRVVLVHAAATLVVGALAAGVTYGVYTVAGGGQPVTALVFLLLGGVALVAALR